MKSAVVTTRSGFTIVELLIVVVVIAILAGVTVMAYTGIQQRTKNATSVAAVDGWKKVILVAATDGGTMPPAGTCLGRSSDYPAGDGFAANQCILVDGAAGGASYSDSAFSTWGTVVRPSARMATATYTHEGSLLKGRGIWISVNNAANKTLSLAWVSQIGGECGSGTPVGTQTKGSLAGGYCMLNVSY